MDKSKQIEELIDKAARAGNAVDALQYSQAACNAANALCSLAQSQKLFNAPSGDPLPPTERAPGRR